MFIPHTDVEREEMLAAIGLKEMADLFEDVPAGHRFPALDLPEPLTEIELLEELRSMQAANESTRDLISFLGAGAYNHFVPSAVDAIIQRGEFLTAYTPYQPEISQGTLQSIFEFQSVVANLTGMEVANASHYDGATAVAEAVNMAFHHFRGKRRKIVVAQSLNPQYRQTIYTYNRGSKVQIVGDEPQDVIAPDLEYLFPLIDDQTALVLVQYPDFYGRIFDYTALAEATHEAGALFAVSANPLALGLLKAPGDFGADIVTGEGQPLGIPLSFGGPYLGLFATRQKFVRKMAGRIAGETQDSRGQRGFVLTLTPREQHIRREKATSNICSNQGIMALAATVYLSLLGKHGLRQVAELCYHKAHYAARQISALDGFEVAFDPPFFNEFVVHCPRSAREINAHLLEHDILGGYDLGQEGASLSHNLLVAVTEMNPREEIDYFVEVLKEADHD